ncbi:NAD(P)/FAD-dependent oxidoreductase [Actomonas aquatica]|uniref:NADH:ubiquinone reductase (non-electrogenic) n=1 Tax=Actomonas aquatica TaxID=2866162 RepID=A0ABZ1C5K5_9BACT|nr:NAD(P)/FAD-dependent oxidoreductase [Opitutus sp. WL0086]WRQ87011.1 NAD(P)/FAD-dependent oxidoreductase [Opitutus sp. WL0086]
MSTTQENQLPHIVVLGAGFGGLSFARSFPTTKARITVVDRQNHHLFQPLLYQVATAGLAAPDIAQPIRTILRDKPNLEVLMAEVTAVDAENHRVVLDGGELHYDYLVVALGGKTSYFGKDEWAEYAPGLKSLDDAMRLRRNLLLAYERAERESDPEKRQVLMTTVVVGGGPTGVELAGSFADLAQTVLYRDFDHIDPREARIILVDGGDRLLGNFPPELSAHAEKTLRVRGVEIYTGTRVTDVRAGEVDFGDQTVQAGNIVWAAGVGASPVTESLGAERDRAGRILVEPDFSVPGHPEIFAIGDLVSLTDTKGVKVPGVAQGAMQAGEHVAKAIEGDLDLKTLREPGLRPAFAYWDKGDMATIGRSAAVARIGKLKLRGWFAWVAWLALHLAFLVGLRNRISVLIQWIYAYCTYKRGARIIMGMTRLGPPGRQLDKPHRETVPAAGRDPEPVGAGSR